jgi:hypothetical protein
MMTGDQEIEWRCKRRGSAKATVQAERRCDDSGGSRGVQTGEPAETASRRARSPRVSWSSRESTVARRRLAMTRGADWS